VVEPVKIFRLFDHRSKFGRCFPYTVCEHVGPKNISVTAHGYVGWGVPNPLKHAALPCATVPKSIVLGQTARACVRRSTGNRHSPPAFQGHPRLLQLTQIDRLPMMTSY